MTNRSQSGSLGQLGRVHRLIVALLPDVPGEGLVAGDVALLIEADAAVNRIELVRAKGLDYRVELERAGFLDRLRPGLDPDFPGEFSC
jgi:hypothetical protein